MEHIFHIKNTVQGFRGESGKYLYSLFVALKGVSNKYIRFCNHSKGKSFVEECAHVERVFAYEFYRQWRNQDIFNQNTSLTINAEVPKQLIDIDPCDGGHLYYPDMVLHSGQDCCKGNLIICELKRKEYIGRNRELLFDDLNKLRIYICKETKTKAGLPDKWEPFKLGVFIMIVKETDNKEKLTMAILKKHIGPKIKKFPDEIKKKIVCVVYNGEILIYDTLYNITDTNNLLND